MQNITAIIIGTIICSVFAGAIALEFHARVKNTTKEQLNLFKDKLPKVVTNIYFNPKQSTVYHGTVSDTSGVDYLLIERPIFLIIFKWALLMFFAIGVPMINLIRNYLNHSKGLDMLSIITFSIILLFLRISLFGSKIKKG